jgi:Arc/MetJ-type ribon-helix-helix transcriptional regulator
VLTIRLPDDLGRAVAEAVRSGRFATADDLVAEAVRRFLGPPLPPPEPGQAAPDPVLGSMRDAADELDAVVADAYRKRREETWRDIDVE